MTAVLIPMACWKVHVFPASWGCKQYEVQSEQNGFLVMAKIGAICLVGFAAFGCFVGVFLTLVASNVCILW